MNWRDIGPTTLAAFEAEIRARAPRSPFLDNVEAIYKAIQPHSRLFLGMSWAESRFQTDPSDRFPVTNFNPLNMKTPDGSGWMTFFSYPAGAKGWMERITSLAYKPQNPGVYAKTTTLPELIHVYAPSSDNNDEMAYVRTIEIIVAELKVLEQELGGPPVGVTIGNRPLRIAVGAGHHDTALGNDYETELNGRKANALIKELRKRGHDVYSTHPNDGLGYALYDYNEVARRLVGYVNTTGWKPDYHIECHSEGSAATKCGSFILYPDSGNDVDVDLRDAGGVFAVKLKERTGIGICTILTTSPGVSSEKQSGVGLQGHRLGVFANTEPLNAYCTRLIWEAGAHTCPHDKAIMDRSDFPQKHALATADALEAFAKTRLGWTWNGDEEPVPEPGPTYTAPSLPDWFDAVADSNFPQNQEFENGVRFYAGKKKVRVKKATVQRATSGTKGKRSGPDLVANTPVDILGHFKSGSTKYVLAAGSTEHDIAKGARIKMADLTEVITVTER